MNKHKLIAIVAVGLFVINLMLVGFIFFRNHKPTHSEGPKKVIAERLHFDKAQIQEYEQLIIKHQESIKSKDSLIRQSKIELYTCLITNNTILKDSIEIALGQIQKEIEELHYNHFSDLKGLCKEDQMEYFNDLAKDLAQLFAKEPMGKLNK